MGTADIMRVAWVEGQQRNFRIMLHWWPEDDLGNGGRWWAHG